MLTLALYGLLAVLLAGALFLGAAYLLPAGEQIAPPIRDEPIWDLPAEKRLEYGDVSTVRLPVALRGYRFQETDLLLDRLAEELRERDVEIARLRARAGVDEVYVDEGHDRGPVGGFDTDDEVPGERAYHGVGRPDESAAAWGRPAPDTTEPDESPPPRSDARPDVEPDEIPDDHLRDR